MAKKRYITTDFWRDNFIDSLTPSEKLLFLYLICNPATNLCGIYQLPLRIISSDTNISLDDLDNMFRKFEQSKKAYYIDGWVVLPNASKHQQLENFKISDGIKRELDEDVSKDVLMKIDSLSIPYLYPSDTPVKYKSKLKSKSKLGNINPEDRKMADLLYSLIKERNPAWYVKPNWDVWVDDIRKIREIDGRNHEQIEFMIRWVQNDNFWQRNILSPEKLRKQFNNLVVQAKSKMTSKGKTILSST